MVCWSLFSVMRPVWDVFLERGVSYLFALRKDGVYVWIVFCAGNSGAAVSYVPDSSFCPYFRV